MELKCTGLRLVEGLDALKIVQLNWTRLWVMVKSRSGGKPNKVLVPVALKQLDTEQGET